MGKQETRLTLVSSLNWTPMHDVGRTSLKLWQYNKQSEKVLV